MYSLSLCKCHALCLIFMLLFQMCHMPVGLRGWWDPDGSFLQTFLSFWVYQQLVENKQGKLQNFWILHFVSKLMLVNSLSDLFMQINLIVFLCVFLYVFLYVSFSYLLYVPWTWVLFYHESFCPCFYLGFWSLPPS